MRNHALCMVNDARLWHMVLVMVMVLLLMMTLFILLMIVVMNDGMTVLNDK